MPPWAAAIDGGPVITDRELWACAKQVLDHHGPDVDAFVAERMRALAAAGDQAGTRTWLAIAERVDRLRDLQGGGQARQ
jgi:hypothetical protein